LYTVEQKTTAGVFTVSKFNCQSGLSQINRSCPGYEELEI